MPEIRERGKVVGIYTAHKRGEPTEWNELVHVIPGLGIEGDRYFQVSGISDPSPKTGRQITLIELEAIEDMCRDGIQIAQDQTRRNIITQGISLNDLIGKVFTVGSVELLGIRLCEPCDYLASRTDPRVMQSMAHRGGLRADILTDGYIHINDLITISSMEKT